MIKHIGRHNNKKVVVLYRTVPNDPNFCLLVYSDTLPRTYHDAVMKVLESDPGQQASEFADALFRNLLPDGRNILTVLHGEGLISKVPTNQVIITPDTKNSCRLDELNTMLGKIAAGQGEELAERDAQAGIKDPKKNNLRVTAADIAGDVSPTGEPISPPVLSEEQILTEANLVPNGAESSEEGKTPAQIMKELKAGIAHVKKLEQQLKRMRTVGQR